MTRYMLRSEVVVDAQSWAANNQTSITRDALNRCFPTVNQLL